MVSTQQPPVPDDDLTRIDLVVERLDSLGTEQTTVLFMEAKKATATTAEVIEAEYQVYRAATSYFVTLTEPRPIWAMTCVEIALGSGSFIFPRIT